MIQRFITEMAAEIWPTNVYGWLAAPMRERFITAAAWGYKLGFEYSKWLAGRQHTEDLFLTFIYEYTTEAVVR